MLQNEANGEILIDKADAFETSLLAGFALLV
jgi:hypothetical protein